MRSCYFGTRPGDGLEERIIGSATVEFTLRRPGICLFDHARRKEIQGAALVRSFFCPNILALKLVLGR